MAHATKLVLLALVAVASADMYLQNMRGSNNRLDEARRDRNNANRLFDSQNNNRGGYNVGSLYFFEGERIPIEWTNQHGCGDGHNECDIVIQYMCSDNLRDGVTTRTIPDQPSNCLNYDCNTDVRYGMHEDYDYYMNCKYRFRNRGLFTADRNLNGQTARFTRQNNNGERRGYECPEERDHYPYWHPTPWIDWAILTTRPDRCDALREESENLMGRHFCKLPDTWYHHMVERGGNGNNGFIPNTMPRCEALNLDNTQMTNFLKEQLTKHHATFENQVAAEFEMCVETLADCSTLQGDAFTKCLNDFNQRAVTAEDIETAVPQCGDGWAPHPFSFCRECVPTECADTFIARNMTAFPDSQGCDPATQAPDTATEGYCTTKECAGRLNTEADRKAIDVQRADYMAEGDRFVVEYENDAMTQPRCVTRKILSLDCLLDNLPRAEWTQAPPHKSRLPHLEAPVCREADWSRPNHLGNGLGGHTNGWNISYPPHFHERCAMRIRYNITTGDYNGADPYNAGEVNAALNRRGGGQPAKIQINAAHKIPTTNSDLPYENARGYLFEQNPDVQIFDFFQVRQFCDTPEQVVEGDPTKCYTSAANQNAVKAANTRYCPATHPTLTPAHGPAAQARCTNAENELVDAQTQDGDFELQLAINTAQFGRTFQDRSHRYKAVPRPAALADKCGRLYALNVRGKRGNIVQTFPGTEYDFTPNRLHMTEGDCVHFQWTGSNTNPNNNDGQGKQGTDRHNVALLEYVRGEGGRGVERFGGKGAEGTTWTTKNAEPGYDGYMFGSAPTMGDMQCPPAGWEQYTMPHPNNWRKCVDPALCEWVQRGHRFVEVEGEIVKEPLDCPAGYRVDPENAWTCINAGCPDAVDRPLNTDSFSVAQLNWLMQVGAPDDQQRGQWGNSHPEHLANVTAWGFLGLDFEQLLDLATLENVQLGGEMSELDDAGTYYDLLPHKVTGGTGTFYYMCTRNNNFSNRSQKGKIVVEAAPENVEAVGTEGGVIGMSLEDRWSGSLNNAEEVLLAADYSVWVPRKSLKQLEQVAARVMASDSGRIGMSDAASDVLFLGPSNLASSAWLMDTWLAPVGATRRDHLLEDVMVSMDVLDGQTVWYRISSPGFEKWFKETTLATGEEPTVGIRIHTSSDTLAEFSAEFNVNFELEATWTQVSNAAIWAIEAGRAWVTLTVDGQSYVGRVDKDPESGQPIVVRMPVSVALTYGDVYHWPDTEAARQCIMSGDDSTGCNRLRSKVDSKIDNGVATFAVGASQTRPAGGYYQVSSGSNVPLIVGIAVACFILVLCLVGGAVYFRKHPQKWESARAWGPRKYKSIKRSLASSV